MLMRQWVILHLIYTLNTIASYYKLFEGSDYKPAYHVMIFFLVFWIFLFNLLIYSIIMKDYKTCVIMLNLVLIRNLIILVDI